MQKPTIDTESRIKKIPEHLLKPPQSEEKAKKFRIGISIYDTLGH